MKISVDYTQTVDKKIQIKTAVYLGDFMLKIHFSDGKEKKIDFKPFLKKSLHPTLKKYMDESNFSNFQIIDGNLNWNDYELIFPIWDLYNEKI